MIRNIAIWSFFCEKAVFGLVNSGESSIFALLLLDLSTSLKSLNIMSAVVSLIDTLILDEIKLI